MGKVYSWGNLTPCLGRYCDSSENARIPQEITHFPNKILTLATGSKHALALDFEGKLYAWGDNSYGQIGFSDKKKKIQINYLNIPQEIPVIFIMKIP